MNQTLSANNINPKGLHKISTLQVCKEANLPSGSLKVKGNSLVMPHNIDFGDGTLKKELKLLPKRGKIHGWKDIRSMKLDVNVHDQIKNKAVETISSAVSRHFIHLEQFEVNLEGPFTDDSTLIDFGYKISRNLSQLKILKVIVSRCSKITDHSVKIFAYEIGRYLTNLKQLIIRLEECQGVTEEGIIALTCKISRQMPNLENFELGLSGSPQLENLIVKRISDEICNHLKKLTSFTLDLRRCHNIGDKALEILAIQILKKMHNLNVLKLKFGSPFISDEGITNFAKILFNNLKKINHLEIRFWKCHNLSDEGVNELATLITNSTQLDYLLVDLFECKNITFKGKRNVEKSMNHIPKSIFTC